MDLLLPSCPLSCSSSSCCCCWPSWLFAVGWYWQICRTYSRLLDHVCICISVHVTCTRTCTCPVNVRVCVLVVEGGSPPSSLFSFFLTFGRSFLPLAHAHTHPGLLPQAGERFDAEGSSRSRGANPPLPLPVNTEKKHKTRSKDRPFLRPPIPAPASFIVLCHSI